MTKNSEKRQCPVCGKMRYFCPKRKVWWCENCGQKKCPSHMDCRKCFG